MVVGCSLSLSLSLSHSLFLFVFDDAVNLTSELHDPNAQVNHLHKGKKKKT